jgi:hypothetical protein
MSPLDRARSQVGRLRYVLGAGGRDPDAKSPGDLTGACDCSGFVAWCLGIDRKRPNFAGYGWVSTDSLVAAARSPGTGVGELERPEVGCLVVYPGIYKQGKRVRVGHVGIVSQVPAEWSGDFGTLKVIHCSAGNQRRTKKAVQETSGTAWTGKGSMLLKFSV